MATPQAIRFRLLMGVLLVPYSVAWELLYGAVTFLAIFLPRLKWQLGARGLGNSAKLPHGHSQSSLQGGSIFFCSSAGEYEQAKPIVREIHSRLGSFNCSYVCFSSSGYRFAEVRGEDDLYFLSPPDNPLRWIAVFLRLKPARFFVVRHELWPGFLWAASFFGPVFLVDAALPSSRLSRFFPGLKVPLLRLVSKVFVVDGAAQSYFTHALGLKSSGVVIAGDTKYDQVWFRMQQSRQKSEVGERSIPKATSECLTIIIGSAWEADVDCVVEALKGAGAVFPWRLIIVPHDLSPGRLKVIAEICLKLRSPIRFWSSYLGDQFEVLIVDKMGLLTEMYAHADVAFVGGGMHHRIHNVLEPACYGLALAHGPRYQSSPEAVRLVAAGLTCVVKTPDDFSRFLQEYKAGHIPKGPAVIDFVGSLCGSAERIVTEVYGK